MTNNKACDVFFKINRNNEVTEIQIVDSLNILLKQYSHIQIYKQHKILKLLSLSIILTSERHSPVLVSDAFTEILC